MARMPMATLAAAAPDPTGGAGAGGAGTGGAGAGASDPTAGAGAGDGGDDSDVVVTITQNDDGSYMVYAGDEPDPGDMSSDDASAMGAAGGAPAAQGTPADSIGTALKAAMDIMNAAKSSSGAPGNADDQFAAGYSGSTSPTAAGSGTAGAVGASAQKY